MRSSSEAVAQFNRAPGGVNSARLSPTPTPPKESSDLPARGRYGVRGNAQADKRWGTLRFAHLTAQSMNCPPLMVSVEPVIQPASSAARKVAQRATSSASPRRPTGIWPTIDFITSSDTPVSSSVAT
jgi:hypothetical protein